MFLNITIVSWQLPYNYIVCRNNEIFTQKESYKEEKLHEIK